MQIVIGNVLSTEELRRVRAALARARFVDGTATAGFAARLVKNNRQAEASDRSLGTIRKLIAERVLANEVFRLRCGRRRSLRSSSRVTRKACAMAVTSMTR
jgi:PKHD-type hydroxylase